MKGDHLIAQNYHELKKSTLRPNNVSRFLKECARLGLAISPGSLIFCNYFKKIEKKSRDVSPSKSPSKKVVKEDLSFLSEISRPDKVVAAKNKYDNKLPSNPLWIIFTLKNLLKSVQVMVRLHIFPIFSFLAKMLSLLSRNDNIFARNENIWKICKWTTTWTDFRSIIEPLQNTVLTKSTVYWIESN